MKLKSILFSLVIFSFIISSVSCGSGESAIKNDKLHPFLLCGVNTLHGYGEGSNFYPFIKQFVKAEPGTKDFYKQMSEVYEAGYVYPYGNDDRSGAKAALSSWWRIEDLNDFMETQSWLLTEGHQAGYEKVRSILDENGGVNTDIAAIDLAKYESYGDNLVADLRFMKSNYDKFSKAGIKAWDIARYVNNINFAHAAGYLSDDEGIEMAKKALVEAQKLYDSWADYFNDWNLGRDFWGGDNSTSFDTTISEILDKENAYNIYKYMSIK